MKSSDPKFWILDIPEPKIRKKIASPNVPHVDKTKYKRKSKHKKEYHEQS